MKFNVKMVRVSTLVMLFNFMSDEPDQELTSNVLGHMVTMSHILAMLYVSIRRLTTLDNCHLKTRLG